MKKTLIIAEAGVNHNGSVDLALKLIDAAKEAGADAVKFQSFKTDKLLSSKADKANYQKLNTNINESQYEMIRKLELSANDHIKLIEYCNKKDIEFMSSPFDIDSIKLLQVLGLNTLKIPSGEINNLPYLRAIGQLDKNIILSTGMADLGEIEDAIDILIENGTFRENITVLQCNTEYPTPVEDVNLKAMINMKNVFKVKVGYSDHTQGIEIPLAAVALGAEVIEKHFTLNRNMEGPDHKASLEPSELHQMVSAIRNIEKALGNGIKRPSPSEYKNKLIVRKSLIALKEIKKGERFTEDNIGIKRPGMGISPMRWDEIIGMIASRNFAENDLIEL